MTRLPPLWLAAATAIALGACAAAPVRYYSLAGTLSLPAAPSGTSAAAQAPRIHIEVAPVGVPERLARPQMVVREEGSNPVEGASTRVQVLEQQRWSSPFDSELRDAFGGAIAARAGAVDVTRGGRLPGHPVYRVAIRVQHFDAVLDRQVEARFGWTITRSDDARNAICQVAVSEPAGSGLNGMVQGVQQAVAAAAGQIAAQILQLQATGAARCDAGAALPEAFAPSPANHRVVPASRTIGISRSGS
jgi:uncharacterized lipoprotein YmbA